MLIYVGETVTVKVKGQTWREVTCQHCGGRYFYLLKVTATGVAINPYFIDSYGSPGRAEDEARSNLDHALEHKVAPVPCPHCSMYQESMLPVIRAGRLLWVRSIGRFLLGLGAMLLVPSLLIISLFFLPDDPTKWNWRALAAVTAAPLLPLIVGTGLVRARRRWMAGYDPNAAAYTASRRRLAAERALTPEDVTRQQIPVPPPGLARLGRPPRSKQLVGMSCVRCDQRISASFDSRICPGCGWPVHDRCAAPAEDGCLQCGAGTAGPAARPDTAS